MWQVYTRPTSASDFCSYDISLMSKKFELIFFGHFAVYVESWSSSFFYDVRLFYDYIYQILMELILCNLMDEGTTIIETKTIGQ
jgi:hypothetical protein